MVGFEETVYKATNSSAVVCVVVHTPNITCPVGFPFTVIIQTPITSNDGTRTGCTCLIYMWCFVSVKDLSLTFNPSERKRCSTITDLTSDIFTIVLEKSFDLDHRITLSPAKALIIGRCT